MIQILINEMKVFLEKKPNASSSEIIVFDFVICLNLRKQTPG